MFVEREQKGGVQRNRVIPNCRSESPASRKRNKCEGKKKKGAEEFFSWEPGEGF